MTIQLSVKHWEEILKKGYSLDIIYYLKLIDEGYEPTEISLKNAKLDNIWSTILRKDLAGGIPCKLTKEGRELLNFLSSSEEEPKIIKKKPDDDAFTKWWSTYPATDTFEYRGKKFTGTRALRVKKEDCKAKLHKILNTGEYTIDELIEALKIEINQKAENSYKTGQNKMSYFQNSLTYLNQATYDPFVELVRKGHKSQEQSKPLSGVEI